MLSEEKLCIEKQCSAFYSVVVGAEALFLERAPSLIDGYARRRLMPVCIDGQ